MRAGAALIGISGFLLAACASSAERQATAPMSFDEVQQVIVANKSYLWKDPTSIQEAKIGRPYSCSGGLAHIGNPPVVCACVSLNARNAFGGYVGVKQYAVLIATNRTISDVMPARMGQDICEGMTPFPALDGSLLAAPPLAKR